ncbi:MULTISPECIES: phosphatase PAP2 family protein [unclassified Pseudoxanthomonas]|uniref:phosphatase PAP2 family protein n=1 Tax=unclassified Pseudoxanthomonas TaxID=2645906 RepID=UPI0008E4BC8B|nr:MULTISPECIES: phosphatase PAP2 family protein [unclassified Pseudoxanthomonas]PPJ41137.1 phosphatase PAP2 family protein [Pseudoxanthomonas sp. KAs_5_3]SFV31150.1 Membrane-associated enzyme, PAP2 (acid phosphatase) superfamily [Pseudoxanthomonas sp. YR558]
MSVSPSLVLPSSRSDLSRLFLVSTALLLLAWWAARQVDLHWATRLFQWEGGAWALKRSVGMETVLHLGGRRLSQVAWAGLLVATLWRWRSPDATWTRPAARLLLAVFASIACVAVLKSLTHMDCPWDLAGLGGQRPYVGLFEARPASMGPAACFPAAHAAGGYAWVALYFFFLHVAPRWRRAGLGVGLLAGIVFGLAQQLRGAHFLSHDVASLAVCWTVACTIEWLHQRGAWTTVETQA